MQTLPGLPMPTNQFMLKEQVQGLPMQKQVATNYPMQLKAIGPREWQIALSVSGGNHQQALARLQHFGYDVNSFIGIQ